VLETDGLNSTARLLMESVLRRYPAWASFASGYGPEEDAEAEPGSVCFEVPSPAHGGRHRLRIYLRGNTIEIAYHDDRPPGPAEAQFVFSERDKREAIESALDFVSEIINDRVVVGREILPALWRLLRGRACEDLPRFLCLGAITKRERRRLRRIVSWTGACDQDQQTA
jgi:hypothetical protein